MRFYPAWLPPNWWWQLPQTPNTDELAAFVGRCQNEDGGLANWPGGVSYMECCYHGTTILNLLNSTQRLNEAAITEFMCERFNEDGGFSDWPGGQSTLFNTFYGVVSLNILRQLHRIDTTRVVQYILARFDSKKGAFLHDAHGEADLVSTFWALTSLEIVGALGDVDRQKLKSFIVGCQDDQGGFGSAPGRHGFMEYTSQALMLLRLLRVSLEPDQTAAVEDFVKKCRAVDGRYSERPMVPPTDGDTMWALTALALLGRIDTGPADLLRERTGQQSLASLWTLHCVQAAYMLCVPNEIVIKPEVVDVQLLANGSSHIRLFNTLSASGGFKRPPEVCDGTSTSIQKANQILSEIESAIARDDGKQSYRPLIDALSSTLSSVLIGEDLGRSLDQADQAFFQITVSDDLAPYPFELCSVSSELICLKHAVGRFIATKAQAAPKRRASFKSQVRVLVVGAPMTTSQNNLPLPKAEKELQDICRILGNSRRFSVTPLIGKDATRAGIHSLIEKTSEPFDVIHIAGHSYVDAGDPARSGFQLHDGVLGATDLARSLAPKAPSVIFANVCSSLSAPGKTVAYEQSLDALATPLIQLGASFIGSYWPIFDDEALIFALRFYESLSLGAPVGEAMRSARMEAFVKSGGKGLTWAAYALLGNPSQRVADFEYMSSAPKAAP